MSEFYTILTDIGLQKHNNCVLNGTKFLETTTCHIGIGDGNGVSYNPTSSQTALIHEVLTPRLPIEEVSYNESTGICVKVTLPTSSGGFWIREVGVYDADGDLVIIVKQAPSYKPTLAEGANKDITLKVHSKDVNASVVTIGIDASLEFLAISGGKMKGNIDMDGNEISNLPHYTDPEAHSALLALKADKAVFGTCATASATAEKVVTATGFVNAVGNKLFVTFDNKNTAIAPTLNIDGSVVNLKHEDGSSPDVNHPMYFPANCKIEFISDGTNLVLSKKIVKSYNTTTSFYKIYSDGFIEQGAYIPSGTGYVTFAVAFSINVMSFSYSHVAYSGGYHYLEAPAHPTLTGYSRSYTMAGSYLVCGY